MTMSNFDRLTTLFQLACVHGIGTVALFEAGLIREWALSTVGVLLVALAVGFVGSWIATWVVGNAEEADA